MAIAKTFILFLVASFGGFVGIAGLASMGIQFSRWASGGDDRLDMLGAFFGTLPPILAVLLTATYFANRRRG